MNEYAALCEALQEQHDQLVSVVDSLRRQVEYLENELDRVRDTTKDHGYRIDSVERDVANIDRAVSNLVR